MHKINTTMPEVCNDPLVKRQERKIAGPDMIVKVGGGYLLSIFGYLGDIFGYFFYRHLKCSRRSTLRHLGEFIFRWRTALAY